MTRFSLARKRVGAYFNDGEHASACQVAKGREANAKLIDCVRSSEAVFFALYNRDKRDAELMKRLDDVLAELSL